MHRSRVGTLEQTVYGGDDKQHKGWVKLSTKKVGLGGWFWRCITVG